MHGLKLVLSAPDSALCKAWSKYFDGLPNVDIVAGRFEQIAGFDCMVSAANSFGLMDGGVDLAIVQFFGKPLMDRIQDRIVKEYLGEQPVGTCMLVETGHEKHPFVAHTPTMRVPMEISRTDNTYLAMWAMLVSVHRHNHSGQPAIETVVCPGLGTGTGRVPPGEAARQMSLAYANYVNPPSYIDWRLADKRQQSVRYGGDLGNHFPPANS